MTDHVKQKPGPKKSSQAAIEAGRRGGLANVQRHGPEHMRRIGRKGGETLLATRGREYYVAIAKKEKR